jgi:hypothetical protein
MPPAVPAPHQHQAALAKAALARASRRQLREQISRGELSIAAVLDRVGTDPVVARTRVADLLNALPGYGRVAVTVLLCDTRIHPSRRAGGLGRRQRQALLDALTEGSPRADRSGWGWPESEVPNRGLPRSPAPAGRRPMASPNGTHDAPDIAHLGEFHPRRCGAAVRRQ